MAWNARWKRCDGMERGGMECGGAAERRRRRGSAERKRLRREGTGLARQGWGGRQGWDGTGWDGVRWEGMGRDGWKAKGSDGVECPLEEVRRDGTGRDDGTNLSVFLGRIAAKRIVRHVGAKSKRSTLGDGTCSVLLRGFSNLLLGRPLTGLMRPAPRASSSLSVVGRAVGRARRADSNRRQVDRQHLDPGQDDLFTVPQAQDHGGEVAVVPGTRDDSANNLTGLLVT